MLADKGCYSFASIQLFESSSKRTVFFIVLVNKRNRFTAVVLKKKEINNCIAAVLH